jgi:hypothetical protein
MRLPSPIVKALLMTGIVGMAGACSPVNDGEETSSVVPPPAIQEVKETPASLGSGVALRQVDGGTDYFDFFENALSPDASFFPIAVWNASVLDDGQITQDRSLGINTYIELTPDSDVGLIQRAGMYAMTSTRSEEASGFVMPDEVDMWAGAGNGEWSGHSPGECDICVPSTAKCSFTIMKEAARLAPDRLAKYANYGKGVTFWMSDADASHFVNTYSDIISADNYWFTDPNICNSSEGGSKLNPPRNLLAGECRLASNYGWTIDRVRSLVSPPGSKPVWALVEVGHPFSEKDSPTITIEQIRAAVWSSLIHGARGIVYFNHSFGGECASQNVLRDCGEALRSGMRKLNKEIAELAPVLNAPFVDNAVQAAGELDVAVKLYDGDLYVLAVSGQSEDQPISMRLACALDGDAVVVGEDRSIPLDKGLIQDTFTNANAVHIYRIAVNSCGL